MVHGTKPVNKINSKLSHVGVLDISQKDRVFHRSIREIRPSPENDQIYKPVDSNDPAILRLADSIRDSGLLEPILISRDQWIISGHRRYAACVLAGLKLIPVRFADIWKEDDPDRFITMLKDCNEQRVKTKDEQLREAVLSINGDDAYQTMIDYRKDNAGIKQQAIVLNGEKKRCKISRAKQPFIAAIRKVLEDRKDYWPLSDRMIHYALLNDPPLRHASKPESRYINDAKSYDSLTELLTRARIDGTIPWEAIGDETRPVTLYKVHQDPSEFLRKELNGFLKGYWRNLLQSQPNHIEIICEKNTVAPFCREIAEKYCIPLTSGRGFCSAPPRKETVDRFRKSGKENLVMLFVTDFDPEGEEIAHSYARSIRDDFKIAKIHPVKVALTYEHVKQFNLPEGPVAKQSSNRKKFVEKYGEHVFELEAISPAVLQALLTQAIDDVIDIDRFNEELQKEREVDSVWIAARRKVLCSALAGAAEGEVAE